MNSDAKIRRKSTIISSTLNNVYRNISQTVTFENFEFIFYSPVWATIFTAYVESGGKLTDVIEAVDGFHPSQTGNAVFGATFFQWLVDNHPKPSVQ